MLVINRNCEWRACCCLSKSKCRIDCLESGEKTILMHCPLSPISLFVSSMSKKLTFLNPCILLLRYFKFPMDVSQIYLGYGDRQYLSLILPTPSLSLSINLSVSSGTLLLSKKHVFSMRLSCIWWWGSSSRDQIGVKYLFITINSMSTLAQSDSTCTGNIYRPNWSTDKLFVFDRTVRKKIKSDNKKKTLKCQYERVVNTIL